MPGLEIHPLSDLRDEAAALLAERYARQRAAEPLLPAVDDFAAHVPDEDGLVATRGGKAVAYLAGSVANDTATVDKAGVAAADPEAVRDLFAALAERWEVERFMVFVPASETALVEPFFRLAFGWSATLAVQEAAAAAAVDFGGTIRDSVPEDLRAFAEHEQMLWRLQTLSPSFSGIELPPLEEHEEGWSDLWDGTGDLWSFVAERDGQIVGSAVMYRRPYGDLRVPEDNVDLAFAASTEDARGTGVGVALTAHVLGWAAANGFRSVTTDWRMSNLFSSRFWPRRGFRPQYVRLYRRVP